MKIYEAQFEGWKSMAKAKNLGISERDFVNIFIYGLRTEIKREMPKWTPQTLPHATILAEIQEDHLNSSRKKAGNGVQNTSDNSNSFSNSAQNCGPIAIGVHESEKIPPKDEGAKPKLGHQELDNKNGFSK